MGEIIDFKTKQKLEPPKIEGYKQRTAQCIDRERITGRPCDCNTCVNKRILANKLLTISNWLCLDYMDKNKGEVLYWGDWLDVITSATEQVYRIVTLPKK